MLVSVTEFRSYLNGVPLREGQAEAMVRVLSGTQQKLETWLNRPLEYVQIREIVRSDRQGFLYLSVTPVRKIISCGVTSASGTMVAPTGLVEPYVISRDPILPDDARTYDRAVSHTTNFGLAPGGIRVSHVETWHLVEYIGGYNFTTDDGLKLAIMQVAAREWRRNFMPQAGLAVGGDVDNTEPGDTRAVGWTKDELTQLERYRRRIYL
jgi:hypothetical protein